MKINKQDEYGIRILLRIARADSELGLSIPQLSEIEEMSQPYVAKITRCLRMSGFIESTRGQRGGYVLANPANLINMKDVICSLGGLNLAKETCDELDGQFKFCTNSVDCSMKSLWTIVQYTIDKVLETITLQDLVAEEADARTVLDKIISANMMEEAFTV